MQRACVEFISNVAKTYNTTNDITVLYEIQENFQTSTVDDVIEDWEKEVSRIYAINRMIL